MFWIYTGKNDKEMNKIQLHLIITLILLLIIIISICHEKKIFVKEYDKDLESEIVKKKVAA